MLPLPIQRSALPESNPSPLMDTLLKGNTPDFKSRFRTSTSLSETTNSNIALDTSSYISNERHWKTPQVRRASCSQNCVLSAAQSQSTLEGTHRSYSQDNVSPSSLSCRPSTDKVFADQEVKPRTNDQICHLIADKVSKYRSTLSVSGASCALKGTTQKKEEPNTMGLDTVSGMTSSNRTKENAIEHLLKRKILKDPQYEDISDADDVSEPTKRLKSISERDLGWRTNHSHKPCDVLKGEQEMDHQPDDDDDDWVVIPVRMLNIEFELGEDQHDPENGLQHKCPNKDSTSSTLCEPAPKPIPASAFSQMEVFDTPVQQEQALKSGQLSFVVPSSCGDHEQRFHTLQNRKKSCSKAEDSCETEDSCDYSSGPECNYLTVSKLLLKNVSAPMQPKVEDSEFEKENENDEAMNLLKSKTRTRQKCSKEGVIINLDSGNESDKNYPRKTRRRRKGFEVSKQKSLNNQSAIIILSDSDD